mgnify:CR=1 FL=1
MKRLVIAIDCDDVLLNASQYIVDTYNRQYGTHVALATAHTSSNPDWNAERDEVFRRLHAIQSTKSFGEIMPRLDAIKSVKSLAALHELHLVTARDEAILDVTKRMLDRHFAGCFAGIHHVGPDKSKGEVCREIGATVLVDDNSRHLLDALEHEVELAIWFGDYPWQSSQQFNEHIVRAVDWSVAEEMIHVHAR